MRWTAGAAAAALFLLALCWRTGKAQQAAGALVSGKAKAMYSSQK